jgi:hypothetical protein
MGLHAKLSHPFWRLPRIASTRFIVVEQETRSQRFAEQQVWSARCSLLLGKSHRGCLDEVPPMVLPLWPEENSNFTPQTISEVARPREVEPLTPRSVVRDGPASCAAYYRHKTQFLLHLSVTL